MVEDNGSRPERLERTLTLRVRVGKRSNLSTKPIPVRKVFGLRRLTF